jgi:hypothetical protein
MKPLLAMRHYVAYHGTRRVEVDAYTFITAQQVAAELLGTKRVHDVQMFEDQAPKGNNLWITFTVPVTHKVKREHWKIVGSW